MSQLSRKEGGKNSIRMEKGQKKNSICLGKGQKKNPESP